MQRRNRLRRLRCALWLAASAFDTTDDATDTAVAIGTAARKAAEQAIEKMRAARKPADDYKNLRKEVTSLKQANSKLTKELVDLKKRFDAALPEKKEAEKKK